MGRGNTRAPRAFVPDLLVGHAASELLYALAKSELLEYLQIWRTATEIARKYRFDLHALTVILEFLSAGTNVISRRGARFRLSQRFMDSALWRSLLIKHVGAYGEVVRRTVENLRGLRMAHRHIDGTALADAYK